MRDVCEYVFVKHSASGKKSWGSQKIERLIYQDLSIYLCVSFSLTLSSHWSHLVAEWSSFNAKTTIMLCFLFLCMCLLCLNVCGHSRSLHINCTFYTKFNTFTHPLKLHLYHSSFIFLTPLLCLSLSPSRYASSVSSLQCGQTHHYPSMQVLIHCPSVYVLF